MKQSSMGCRTLNASEVEAEDEKAHVTSRLSLNLQLCKQALLK